MNGDNWGQPLISYRMSGCPQLSPQETGRWAVKLLEGRVVDDLDGGMDSQKGYKSLMHGESPEVMTDLPDK